MNPFAIVSLISTFISVILAALVYTSNPKSSVNRYFALACVLMAYTSFTEYGLRQAHDQAQAAMLQKADALWPLMLAVILHFILVFTEHQRLLANKWTYAGLYLPALCITVLITATDIIVSGVFERYWGWTYEYWFNTPTFIYIHRLVHNYTGAYRHHHLEILS